jgi:hypothetical protein
MEILIRFFRVHAAFGFVNLLCDSRCGRHWMIRHVGFHAPGNFCSCVVKCRDNGILSADESRSDETIIEETEVVDAQRSDMESSQTFTS